MNDPAEAAAAHQRGSSLYREGRIIEAAEALGRAVRLALGEASYRVSLAAALGRLDRHAEAITQLRAALLTGGGRMAELHNNLGASLEKLGRLDEAAAALTNAVALKSDYVEARKNLAGVLRKLGRPVAAAAAYNAALALRPSDADLLGGLSAALVEAGDAKEVIAVGRKLVAADPDSAAARSSLLYTLHYSHEYDAETLYRECVEWGRLFCDPLRGSIAPHENGRDPNRKLCVGYVSPDLREHTVTKFVSAAIEHHDREHFEVGCYSDAERPDHVSERLKGWAEHWHDTRGLSTAGDGAIDPRAPHRHSGGPPRPRGRQPIAAVCPPARAAADEHGRVFQHHRPEGDDPPHRRLAHGPAGDRALEQRDAGADRAEPMVLLARAG
jgi:predicted O-linked N-acetylglucosamine transferase (SPINDLY family)